MAQYIEASSIGIKKLKTYFPQQKLINETDWLPSQESIEMNGIRLLYIKSLSKEQEFYYMFIM